MQPLTGPVPGTSTAPLDLTDVETHNSGGGATAGATAGAFAGSLAAAIDATTRELTRTVPIGGTEPPLQPPDDGSTEEPTGEPAPADVAQTDTAPASSPSPRRGAPLVTELQYFLGQDPPTVDRLQVLARYAAAGAGDVPPTPPPSVDDAAEEQRKRVDTWVALAMPTPVVAPKAPLATTSQTLAPVAVDSVAGAATPSTGPSVAGSIPRSPVASVSPAVAPQAVPSAPRPAECSDSPTSDPAPVTAQPPAIGRPAQITDPAGVDPVMPGLSQPPAWVAPAGSPDTDVMLSWPGAPSTSPAAVPVVTPAPGPAIDDATAAPTNQPVEDPADQSVALTFPHRGVVRSGDPIPGPEVSALTAGPERAADGVPPDPPEQVAARVIADPTSLGAMAQQALAAAARSAPTSPASPASAGPVVSQIVHGIQLASQQSGRSVAFRLQPEGLGSVAIRLSHGASGVSVQILLDSTPTHDLVQAGLPDLARSIAERGITVDQLQVGLASGQLGGGDAGYREAPRPALVLPPPTRAGRVWEASASLDEPVLATNRVDYRV